MRRLHRSANSGAVPATRLWLVGNVWGSRGGTGWFDGGTLKRDRRNAP